MAPPLHAGLTPDRWHQLDIVEQLANVGSEVDRAIRAHEAGRTDRRDHAIARALELFDLTATDPRWHGPRRREVLRGREYFCRLFFDAETIEPDAGAFLRTYFLQFAVAARRGR